MAAYAYHAMVLGYTDKEVNTFFYKGMRAVGMEEASLEALLPIVLETGNVNLKCMALLDKANTETYGTPVPTTVPLTIEKGPFIVVSGHDLYDRSKRPARPRLDNWRRMAVSRTMRSGLSRRPGASWGRMGCMGTLRSKPIDRCCRSTNVAINPHSAVGCHVGCESLHDRRDAFPKSEAAK